MSKFELMVSDFQYDLHEYYEEYKLSVLLESKGLRHAPTSYWLWFFVVLTHDEIIDSGPFRWSTAIGETITDKKVADIIASFYVGTTKVKQAH